MWKRDASPKAADLPPAPPTPAQAASTALPSRQPDPPPTAKVAVNLGKSVTIKGELSASEDLTLSGQVEGRVTVPDHTLTIGPDANVQADISAGAVVIMGAVTGNITASRRVEIRATGAVTGDIASPGLAIDDGGQVVGKVQMTGQKSQGTRHIA